jgi:D-tyrosyl-tRNA(Tyr) deacylase
LGGRALIRALIQRVTKAQVAVDDQIMGAIEQGLFIFVCAMQGDTRQSVRQLVEKNAKLRILKDEAGRINLSVAHTGSADHVAVYFGG